MNIIKKNQPSNRSIGEFLKQKRREKMISGREMGKLINISQQQVSRYENGQTKLTLDILSKYLAILNINWIDFIYSVGFDLEIESKQNFVFNKDRYLY